MSQSAEINELVKALKVVQGSLQGAPKDSTNSFYSSKYANLESVWGACRRLLAENGLCVIQTTDSIPSGICVVTTLAHASGQWIRGILPISVVKHDPQSVGAAITYSRRFALAAIVGIVQTDDDAESAMERPKASLHVSPLITKTPPNVITSITNDSEEEPYKINFGKHKDKTLDQIAAEIGYDGIRSYVNWLEKDARDKNKPMSPNAQDFVNRATRYVVEFENGSTG